ncbi:MAG: energy-coupling factor transporter ATPase [Caldiserica bacterium]|nr:MAG: energy-coupling factor transporter ATPase [Caldisericota bacterium]
MIEFKNVSFSYLSPERIDVLKNVNLKIDKGEFVSIIGRNGSGKSTLARLISVLLLPSEGEVFVDGMNTREEENLYKIRRKVGMVFQNPDNQIVSQIVEEDVAFGLENLNFPPDKIREKVDEVLEEVGLYEFKNFPPHFLSGGQKQKLAIAGVLVMEPEYLVLDEPTSLLDPRGRRDVINLILKLHKKGITIVLITHRMEEASMSQRVIVLNDGRIEMEGSPQDVFKEVERLRSIDLSVPPLTYLSYLLKKEGYPLEVKLWKREDLLREILQLKLRV